MRGPTGSRIFTGTENRLASAEDRGLNHSDIIDGYRIQAENYVTQNENRATVFIGTGHRDQILESVDKMKTAKFIARNEPGTKPDFIEDLEDHAAFLIALAEELDKPKYNQ